MQISALGMAEVHDSSAQQQMAQWDMIEQDRVCGYHACTRPGKVGGHLGVTKHDADLHAELIDKEHRDVMLVRVGSDAAEVVAHQPRLRADLWVPGLPQDLRLRQQRRHRVHHDDRHRAAADDLLHRLHSSRDACGSIVTQPPWGAAPRGAVRQTISHSHPICDDPREPANECMAPLHRHCTMK